MLVFCCFLEFLSVVSVIFPEFLWSWGLLNVWWSTDLDQKLFV